MHISLLPVYSKLADPTHIPSQLMAQLPANWHLSQHQLDTYNALMNPQIDVVINTAMTGDGKSLAGLLPLIINKRATLALYPTNELIHDQQTSATHTFKVWNIPERWIASMHGAILDQMSEDMENTRRGDAIEQLFRHNKLLLSNPDIFHAIVQFFYQHPGRAPDWLVGRVGDMFQQLTFDEFHVFDVPQVVAVLTALLFLYEQAPGRFKTLFLSATPASVLVPYLEKAGLRIYETSATYHHGDNPGSGWRRILHGCDVFFDAMTAEAWIETHLDDILLPFFRQHHPAAKGAIIVNSVAVAHRLEAYLRPKLASTGLTVMLNTGLTARETRRDSYEADILIGTSTIDVGVDFKINFLLFESGTEGTFLQRLGRLGRHDTVVRNGVQHPFSVFYACALVPEFVRERLFVGHGDAPALFHDGAIIPRDELHKAMKAAFPEYTSFKYYVRQWGRFLPAHVVLTLAHKTIRDSYANTRERLQQRYEQTFAIRIGKTWGARKQMFEEGKENIVEEARAFRGQSPFACGVLTLTPTMHWAPMVYDTLWLLANANLELLDEQSFLDATGTHEGLAAVRRANPIAYFRLLSFRPKRTNVMIRLSQEMSDWDSEKHHTVQVMSGIKIDMQGADSLNALNRHLTKRKLVGLMIPGINTQTLRRRLQLPPLFTLYTYQNMYQQEGTIAFARQALLLDTMKHRLMQMSDDTNAVIL